MGGRVDPWGRKVHFLGCQQGPKVRVTVHFDEGADVGEAGCKAVRVGNARAFSAKQLRVPELAVGQADPATSAPGP